MAKRIQWQNVTS